MAALVALAQAVPGDGVSLLIDAAALAASEEGLGRENVEVRVGAAMRRMGGRLAVPGVSR